MKAFIIETNLAIREEKHERPMSGYSVKYNERLNKLKNKYQEILKFKSGFGGRHGRKKLLSKIIEGKHGYTGLKVVSVLLTTVG